MDERNYLFLVGWAWVTTTATKRRKRKKTLMVRMKVVSSRDNDDFQGFRHAIKTLASGAIQVLTDVGDAAGCGVAEVLAVCDCFAYGTGRRGGAPLFMRNSSRALLISHRWSNHYELIGRLGWRLECIP